MALDFMKNLFQLSGVSCCRLFSIHIARFRWVLLGARPCTLILIQPLAPKKAVTVRRDVITSLEPHHRSLHLQPSLHLPPSLYLDSGSSTRNPSIKVSPITRARKHYIDLARFYSAQCPPMKTQCIPPGTVLYPLSRTPIFPAHRLGNVL
jgi:hypothetical protein